MGGRHQRARTGPGSCIGCLDSWRPTPIRPPLLRACRRYPTVSGCRCTAIHKPPPHAKRGTQPRPLRRSILHAGEHPRPPRPGSTRLAGSLRRPPSPVTPRFPQQPTPRLHGGRCPRPTAATDPPVRRRGIGRHANPSTARPGSCPPAVVSANHPRQPAGPSPPRPPRLPRLLSGLPHRRRRLRPL